MLKMEKDTLVSFWVSDYPLGLRGKIKDILETKDSMGFKTQSLVALDVLSSLSS